MRRKLKFSIAYDGTAFHGWQRQANVRTVQEEIERVAQRVLGQPCSFLGASRTDAGVHARGQAAEVTYAGPIPLENLRRAMNHRLPDDIVLMSVRVVPEDFDVIRGAREKLYRYRVHNTPDCPRDAQTSRYAWHVWHPLDLDRLRAAARGLVGTHDFTSFASQGSPRASNVRTVRHIGVRRVYNEILIDVLGDGFLYNQVRNMVGTLIEVGRGHWSPERVPEILAARDRSAAAGTAPAEGLCLEWVRYDPLVESRE